MVADGHTLCLLGRPCHHAQVHWTLAVLHGTWYRTHPPVQHHANDISHPQPHQTRLNQQSLSHMRTAAREVLRTDSEEMVRMLTIRIGSVGKRVPILGPLTLMDPPTRNL